MLAAPVPAPQETSHMADVTVDTKGLNCPLPILKAKKAIRDVPSDGTLEVLSTDPGAIADFEAFCRATGHTLVGQDQQDGVLRFVIRKTG